VFSVVSPRKIGTIASQKTSAKMTRCAAEPSELVTTTTLKKK